MTARTPPQCTPPRALEVEKEVICEPLYDSAPNLSAAEVRDGGASDLRQVPFASNRIGKRRREIGTDELKTSIDNLNKLFATSMSQQESKLADVMSVVNEIRQQNADIRMSVDFLSEEYNDLKKKLIAMDIERKDQILYIKSLEDKVESMERNSRSTGLELRNFTQKAGENKSDLSELVMKIGEKLQTPVEQLEIKDVFRTKSKAENKPIIVEFTSVIKKEAILESLKKFKRDRKGQLESSSFGIHGLSTRVFISETLTTKNKRMFTLAREFAKTNSYKFCWSSHGYVYLRKGGGQPAIRIAADDDLDRLKSVK